MRRAQAIIKRLWDKDTKNFWLFEDIIDMEEKYGFKSTFFFASMNKFDECGLYYDVDYKIDQPKFTKVFKKIETHGFEIGLHASYNAYLHSNHFFVQKQKIINASRFEVTGLRHHCWHMGRNIEQTLEMHEKAGFKYDSSIAFNERLGFRRNVAFPYYPWSEYSMREIKTIQLPVFCMDGNLFYHFIEVDEAVECVKRYIEKIKDLGGLGVIDWHVRTSYPKNAEFFKWGKAYVKIIECLSTDSEIWVTNLSNITSWLKKREEQLLA